MKLKKWCRKVEGTDEVTDVASAEISDVEDSIDAVDMVEDVRMMTLKLATLLSKWKDQTKCQMLLASKA